MENIICHICSSSAIKVYGKKSGYTLYRCTNCGLIFVYPLPTNIGALYSKDYFKDATGNQQFGYTDYDKDKEPMREVFLLYLKKLEALVLGRNIFDVGAATGYFLDLAKERGWKTFGIEISAYAKREAEGRGHNMYDIETLHRVPNMEKFDVATFWDVLEHVTDPRKYLQLVYGLLTDNGYIAINTVDASSMWAKIWGIRWHLIVPPEHLYYYAPRNLNILLKEVGFEIIEVRNIGKKFSLAYICAMLGRFLGITFFGKLAQYVDTPFWRKFSISINLHDNVFIIAKKISNA